ncbi:DUF2156 domain-containing protein [Youngiibacter fragilis]|uniref:Phosphatidylglycerol lysyltransferase C-terminal domain-containing protein n=1 Tax=Youngiibacter fragilis 232.1 TaxID=994573 RepID=V7IB72_9CLOT|nr:phosphatidylglycerol lysyltransferase domain-containing protein [Youngiibacter fragilis]ETA82102.1 hypothetical protein T472_0202920 [Youngiibacter fragilis 232.1]
MELNDLDLASRAVFNGYLKPFRYIASTYSFTNLYLWRRMQNIRFHADADALYIVKGRKDPTFLPPVVKDSGNASRSYSKLISHLLENGMPLRIRDARAEDVELMLSLGLEFEATEDIDNNEYVYLVEKLRTFSGKKLHSKKNHYNNFIKNYEFETKPLEDSREEAKEFARKWFSESSQSESLLEELNGIIELLDNMEHFDIVGLSVFIDGHCHGFTIMEILNSDCILNHIEKADQSINGLYTFIIKTVLDSYGEGIRYTNREQDLGIPGLRKSKQSLHPEFMEKKFLVNLTGGFDNLKDMQST